MAKLDDMFNKLGGSSKSKQVNKTDKENVSVLRNSDTEQEEVLVKIKSENDTENHLELSNNKSFIDSFLEKKKKATVEETHTRQTFLIHNDLLKRMNKAAKGRERGFKTALVNEAIKRMLDEIEAK